MPEQLMQSVSKKPADYQLDDLDVRSTVGTGKWMGVGDLTRLTFYNVTANLGYLMLDYQF